MHQREDRQQNIQRTIWAAQALFVKNGIARTTIAQIAKEVHLSEMSIYRYFQNKPMLIARVWQESLMTFYTDFMRQLQEETTAEDTGLAKFQKCLELYVRVYTVFPEWYTYTREMFLLSSDPTRSSEYYDPKFWEEFYQEIPMPLLSALKEGQEDGSIKSDINIYEVYQLIHNVYTGTCIYQQFDNKVTDIDIFRFTGELLVNYIRAA